MMTRNDAVALQLFCVMMTFSDALPVLSTKNDGHCHHSRMGVFPDYYLKIIGWPARLPMTCVYSSKYYSYAHLVTDHLVQLK